MPKKPKPAETAPDEVWINPNSNLKGTRGNRAFDGRLGLPSSSRLLELADVALGLKKPEPKKKKKTATANGSAHDVTPIKTEPYSR
jgi:hypothetical protein